MSDFFHNRGRLVLPTLSGVLGALSLDVPYLWPLVFVALIPLLYFVHISRSYREAFFGGWLGGFVLIGGALIWFWETLPLDWLGVDGTFTGIAYVSISWGILSLVLSLAVAFWSVGGRYLCGKGEIFLTVLPLLWVVCEYLRTWFFAVLTYGEGTVFGAHFTAGFLGYALANHPLLLQVASSTTIYGLSFVVVVANVLLWYGYRNSKTVWDFLAVSGSVMFLTLSSFMPPVSTADVGDASSLNIALVQTSFPAVFTTSSAEDKAKEEELRALVTEAAALRPQPDAIVLPEDSRFIEKLESRKEIEGFIKDLQLEKPILLVDSARTYDEKKGGATQRLFFYDSKTGEIVTREKAFLVPQGEYVPKLFTFIVGLFGQTTTQIEKQRTYYPGEDFPLAHIGTTPVGGSFCAELLSPSIHSRLAREGAQLILNVSSQSWFHGSRLVYYQGQLAARVRAVEMGLPILVSLNGGIPFGVDEAGAFLQKTNNNKDILTFRLAVPVGG